MAEELKMDENAIKKHVDQLCQDVKIYKVRPDFIRPITNKVKSQIFFYIALFLL